MDLLYMLLLVITGAAAALAGTMLGAKLATPKRDTVAMPEREEMPEMSERVRAQFENLYRYNGTGDGQVAVEEHTEDNDG